MNYALTLLNIIRNSKNGVIVHTPNVTDLIKEIQEETDVQLKPERQTDTYNTGIWDKFWNEHKMKDRINHRKHLLKI